MVTRDDFTQQVKEVLSKRVGNHCSNPDCRQTTSGPNEDASRYVSVGVAAHIAAASPGGPRHDASMSPTDRKAIENGIWLCQNCAKLIDSDVGRYSVGVLENWKIVSETQARTDIESPNRGVSAQLASEFQRVEALMPDLLSEMRTDLQSDPLCREFIVMRKGWAYSSGGQEVLVYYYEEHQNLDNKLRILQNYGLIEDITQGNVGRFVITERFADYLSPLVQSTQLIPWRNRPGGPVFRLHPGINAGTLLCEFEIDGNPFPGGVEARWTGAGIEHDWATPMPQNIPGGASYKKYQMKPVTMGPMPPEDEVVFEVRFYLDDGLHGGRWVWPILQHSKGHWILQTSKGSGVGQPPLKAIW